MTSDRAYTKQPPNCKSQHTTEALTAQSYSGGASAVAAFLRVRLTTPTLSMDTSWLFTWVMKPHGTHHSSSFTCMYNTRGSSLRLESGFEGYC
jgi:hypothetical protein